MINIYIQNTAKSSFAQSIQNNLKKERTHRVCHKSLGHTRCAKAGQARSTLISTPPFFATIASNTFRDLAELDVEIFGPHRAINTCAQRHLTTIAHPNCSLIVH